MSKQFENVLAYCFWIGLLFITLWTLIAFLIGCAWGLVIITINKPIILSTVLFVDGSTFFTLWSVGAMFAYYLAFLTGNWLAKYD